MLCCIDSLPSENFQMAYHVWNRPIVHCKPLVINYVMYAFVLFSWHARTYQTFILQCSILRLDTYLWRLFFTNYYLLAPFQQKLAPKISLQGPLWPSSKIFWLKHGAFWIFPLLFLQNTVLYFCRLSPLINNTLLSLGSDTTDCICRHCSSEKWKAQWCCSAPTNLCMYTVCAISCLCTTAACARTLFCVLISISLSN